MKIIAILFMIASAIQLGLLIDISAWFYLIGVPLGLLVGYYGGAMIFDLK